MIGAQLDNYRVVEKIGEGGMGAVFRSQDIMLERDVALKFLRPELAREKDLVERFRAEAIVLARLNHPYIASVYGLHRHGEDWFMAMEFVPGETLADRLKHVERFSPDAAVRLTSMVLQALDYAHAAGVVHRDIKTANIILTPAGTVKVMDFGIARLLGSQRLTRAGSIVGTLGYMAPEQIQGHEVDGRADIYAIGIVLYEMLAGRVPFTAETDWALMQAQISQPPPPLSEWVHVPQELDAAVMRSLEKQPEHRFQTATDFKRTLDGIARRTLPSDDQVRGQRLEELSDSQAETRLTPVPGRIAWEPTREGVAPTRPSGIEPAPTISVSARPGSTPPPAPSSRESGSGIAAPPLPPVAPRATAPDVAAVPRATPPPVPPTPTPGATPPVAVPGTAPSTSAAPTAAPSSMQPEASAPLPVAQPVVTTPASSDAVASGSRPEPTAPSAPAPAPPQKAAAAPAKAPARKAAAAGRKSNTAWLAVVGMLALAAAGWFAWQRSSAPAPPPVAETEPAPLPATPLPVMEPSLPTPPATAAAELAGPAAGTPAKAGVETTAFATAKPPTPLESTEVPVPLKPVAPPPPEAPPAEVEVPPASEVVFKDVRLVRPNGSEVNIELHLEPTQVAVHNIGASARLHGIAYRDIASATLQESRHARVFVRTTRYWLELKNTAGQGVRLRLDRDNYQDILTAFERRWGRPVARVAPEQDEQQ